ncbi:MAG: DUF3471 domain-containing protein, partial [Pirellulales bacterium]|nr:DUF3471 domain-containing protein [Pirellulales bacterium]
GVLAGQPVKPKSFPPTVKVVPEEVAKLAGQYELSPNFVLSVRAKKDRLFAQATGQQEFRIYPQSKERWFYKIVDAQLTFKLDSAGNAVSVTLHQNGRDVEGKRLDR